MRPTTHTCTKHTPGTRACYVAHKCGCTPCRTIAVRYERERARRKVYETTTPGAISSHVAGDLVRAHLRTLMDAGMGWKRIARAAGVATSTTYSILYGKYLDQPDHPEHRPPRIQVTRAVADKLMAVELDLAPGQIVDGNGARLRLRALVAIGWSMRRLSGRLGVHQANAHHLFHGGRDVTVATRAQVVALYDELWDVEGPSTYARRYAIQHGWLRPMALDDTRLDDPTYRPRAGRHDKEAAAA